VGLRDRGHRGTDAQAHRGSASELPLQAERGSAGFGAQAFQAASVRFAHVAQVRGESQKCAHFRERPQGDTQRVSELCRAVPRLSLSDVRHGRHRGSPELPGDAELLLTREARCHAVDLQRQRMAVLPRLESTIRVHGAKIALRADGRLTASLHAVPFLCACASVRLCV
jgi:hypothetical protein